MQIDPNWTFQQAIDVISGEYRPGGKTTGPLRNRQLESWGQLVGRTRALKELDEAISGYSSVTAFCRDNRITSRTLDSIREFYEELPDDRVRAYIYSGLTLGNWTLLSRLGRGGNAEVWRARHKDNSIAAIKILKHPKGGSLKRFVSEITILNQIRDIPGVLPISDSLSLRQVGNAEHVWFTMPVAVPILESIKEENSIPHLLQGIARIAETLTILHGQGITHRDIKPENILLWKDQWVISDFGIASFPNKEALTVANRKLGPLYYIAPEMLDRADKADATKADVYSLAKTLWVLLTGQTFPPPGEQRRDIPAIQVSTWVVFNKSEQIEDLIDKSTRYNPDDRPSMKEFHTTLLEALKQAKL